MQKARRHRGKRGSDRLKAHGFRICFTPLRGVLFTFPSRYSYAIGLTGVFSLAGWTPRIQTGLHVSRPTQDTTRPRPCSCTGLSPSMAGLSRPFHSTSGCQNVVLQPRRCVATTPVWASPRSLAATGGIIQLFSSPAGTKMFQFPAFASMRKSMDDRPADGRVVPFGNRGIKGHLHLPRAYRSLSRPSSPP